MNRNIIARSLVMTSLCRATDLVKLYYFTIYVALSFFVPLGDHDVFIAFKCRPKRNCHHEFEFSFRLSTSPPKQNPRSYQYIQGPYLTSKIVDASSCLYQIKSGLLCYNSRYLSRYFTSCKSQIN